MKKFLCVCQYGHSRSACLCRVLHGKGQQAVACGWGTAPDAIPALGVWADHILLLESHFLNFIPPDLRHKVITLDVGRDRWSNPYHPELHAMLERMVAESGLLK